MDNTNITFGIEIEALIYGLEELGQKNLESGSGCLLAFKKYLGDHSKSKTQMNIYKHV